MLFKETEEWRKLLQYKLLPHLAGEGCLVAAVAGGTNTGKSTVFNMLLGEDISPVRMTAAATSRPVLIGNQMRATQCLEGTFLPDFAAQILYDKEGIINHSSPENTLFIGVNEQLPDRLVLLDIPDVDSIDKQNWEVAENIQAAGDVLIAVLTGEKYKDEKVVAFFRRAHQSGRIILPLMNKANPANHFEMARLQLADFCEAVGIEDPVWFAVEHDFALEKNFHRAVTALKDTPPLREYLESLDVKAVKAQVLRETVARFVVQTEDFLARVEETGLHLRAVIDTFEERATLAARHYDPEPGETVGKLLHQFIKARRGLFSRTMGEVGQAAARGLAPVGKMVRKAALGRMMLEEPTPKKSAEDIQAQHRRELEIGSRALARDYIQSARSLWSPACELVLAALEQLDVAAAVTAVVDATLLGGDISEEFRKHAESTLVIWWEENPMRRHLLQELDTLLVVSPTAVAVPLAFYTGGVGVPEVMAAAGPMAGEFFSRIMEHQFADKWFDLIAPWRAEQQEKFSRALKQHITHPGLAPLIEVLEPFEGDTAAALRRYQETCRNHSSRS